MLSFKHPESLSLTVRVSYDLPLQGLVIDAIDGVIGRSSAASPALPQLPLSSDRLPSAACMPVLLAYFQVLVSEHQRQLQGRNYKRLHMQVKMASATSGRMYMG